MHIEPLSPGTLLLTNSLRIERVLGQGGFGLTYLCSHTLLRGQVRAVKELAPIGLCTRMPGSPNMQTTSGTSADFAAVRRRFADEAANLLHLAAEGDAVGIVRIHDVWEEFGTVFYSMEYLEGASPFPRVGDYGATAGRWTLVEPLASDLLGALARLERLRIVHGDIKPANVLVSSRKGRPTATLIDFGSARTGSQLQRTFSSNSWTPGYAAPEWTTPALRAEIGPCTDLYGWGLMVYGAMCRFAATLPDQPLSPIDAGTRVLMNADPYANATRELIAAGVPITWANAVGQCIRIRSSERPRSAEELLASLVAAPAPTPMRSESGPVVATEYVRQGTPIQTPAVATPWDAPATTTDDRRSANTRRRVTNALWVAGVITLASIAAVVSAVSDAVDESNQSAATAPAATASAQPVPAAAPSTGATPTPAAATPPGTPATPPPSTAPNPTAPAAPPRAAMSASDLYGQWNIDFARSIQQAGMTEEERAMAMALMGSMQMSITFNADGTMAMNATMMGETKTEGGTFRVTGTTPNTVTIETTSPGEGPDDPAQVESATITFESPTEASIAPQGEDPLFMTKVR